MSNLRGPEHGAELDLLFVRGAREDLRLDQLYVVHAGAHR